MQIAVVCTMVSDLSACTVLRWVESYTEKDLKRQLSFVMLWLTFSQFVVMLMKLSTPLGTWKGNHHFMKNCEELRNINEMEPFSQF